MTNKRKAFICGLKGRYLSNNEIKFLKKHKPWGIILFSRNIYTIKQTQKLTNKIKTLFKDKNYPILIDEEGGRVSRLRAFLDSSIFSAEYFGKLYKKDYKKFSLYFNVYINQISYLLHTLGINLNTVPNLDVKRSFTNKIIGDRSFSSDNKIVSKIGDFSISLFHKNRIGTIIKHIPGHGLAKSDSHKKLPVINYSIKYLLKNDFSVFKNKKSLFAMTAHVTFKKIDSQNCVTHSKKNIKIIRNKILFKNLLISDDLSMKALRYSITENTKKAFTAGCNLVLHCNGKLKEMVKVAENSPYINNFIIKKTSEFKDIIS